MQEHNGWMYVAGKFLHVKAPDGTTRDQPYLAAFDLEIGAWISSFRPDVGGIVIAIEITPDGRLYTSGEMPGGVELFDAVTGAKDNTFNPQIANTWARDLDAGTTYAFTVQAVFVDGSRSAATTPLPVTTEGVVADTPTGFRSTLQTRERAVLTWDNMGSGVTYEIRQDGVLVGTQTSRWFTARNLEPGTVYEFTVQATYANGATSAETAPLSVSTLP